MTQIAVGATREPFFFFAVAMVIYFTVSMISSWGALAPRTALRPGVRHVMSITS